MTQAEPIVVAALYKFAALDDLESIQADLLGVCKPAGVFGTLLIAPEGINGTIAGPREGVDKALVAIRGLPGCGDIEHKESGAETMPFQRMKVRIKREIVALREGGIDPNRDVGTYVEPQDWNGLINDPDVVVIDTRNDYEVEIGSFRGAIDPKTAAFREFPAWVDANLDPMRHRKVAMFCTGGIRCEKATALMRQRGFEEVYHLKGGILKYLEVVPEQESMWQGACFVFDDRISIKHGLEVGDHEICGDCGRPVEPGAACRRCA